MRLAFWIAALAFFIVGLLCFHSHVQTHFIVFSFLASAFLCYAALLQEGTRVERIAHEDGRANALALVPQGDIGSLIVFRFGLPSKFLGMDSALNGQDLAQLKSPRFTRVDIPAGTYELSSAFCSPIANKNLPATLVLEIVGGKFTIVGIAVGLPEKWRWWRLGSKANWRDQIYMTIAPDTAIESTMEYLSTIPMVLPDVTFSR